MCPHHGYENWRLVSYFYEGLTPRERQFVEMMCNGEFLQKDPDEAIEYLNELAEKAHTWTGPSATESTNRSRPAGNLNGGGIYHLREEDNLKAKVEMLTRELEVLKNKDLKPTHVANHAESFGPCFVCGGVDHLAQECPTFAEMRGMYEEQCNALGMYMKPVAPFSDTYNPGWRNHPNFSWKPENQPPAQPPRSYPAPYHAPSSSRSPLEDTLHAFIETQSKTNQKFESLIMQVVEENKEIKSHISKIMSSLSVNERVKFPSQAQSAPQGQHMAQKNLKEVNAIKTRSGKSLHIPTTDKQEDVEEEQSNDSTEFPKDAEVIKSLVKVPFPQALKSGMRTLDPRNEILENLRQVKINLPLLHVIKQVLTYAKVLKDLYIVKTKHHVKKTTFLTEQVSALIEQQIPPKYKDPGCPTIACNIVNHEFGQALLDLGASVNLMPYSIYLQLGLGEIKPTSVVLQLADRSVKKPRGIVEDVLIQIDKFYYPVDFLILDTQSVVESNSKVPLILGRPFLAMANALINCRNGLMKLSFGNMTMEVNIFHIEKQPTDDECHQTYMIDALIDKGVHTTHDFDPLEYSLVNSEFNTSVSDSSDVIDICAVFDEIQDYGTQVWQQKFEELPKKCGKQIPVSMKAPRAKLKSLPKSKVYKVKMKAFHDKNILRKRFKPNDRICLYDFGSHKHKGKLRFRWTDPFLVKNIFVNWAVEIEDPKDGRIFKVNGQRLKILIDRQVPEVEDIPLVDPVYQP